jgi:hypothetical protein
MLEVGAKINDQYVVVEHIGRGGMADVWSARDQRLRRMVAIKTIAVGLTQDIDPIALFRREAQTIASMEHPHILPIYDFGEYGGSLYIVMRFVTGGSLENLLHQNPISPLETLRIADAIAQALDYAHANKIIHLDLKPPNILMDSSGAPYLADFGLATVLDPEGRARNPGSGTLLYMAPEQLVSEVIDHRADIYSFSIMIYHMMTGKLPFDGVMPLALHQMQYSEELPPLENSVPDLPPVLNDILRKGTAKDPAQRPRRLGDIIDQMREALQSQIRLAGVSGAVDEEEAMLIDAMNIETERLVNMGNRDIIEAVDIYTRARHNWAGGQGRFLLGLSHYLVMSGYYQDALQYSLTVDEYGKQMLLRGALEFDHEIEYWWNQLSDESRRWVCLHTVRSGTAPARIRALYRLETLSDDPINPVIGKLVAQALEVEKDPFARKAALQVLGTRATLTQSSNLFKISTEYRGRMLDTLQRIGIEISAPNVWREAVYSPEIDIMIAEQALNLSDVDVANFAARTVGKMRSLTGVRHLANQQRLKRNGALQALALVRDEAPNLPDVVSPSARAYAWVTNTLRRVFENPVDLLTQMGIVLLFAWLAFGGLIYSTQFSGNLTSPTRWGNTIASGLTMGVAFTLLIFVTGEFIGRLKGFWSWQLRAGVGIIAGTFIGTLAWAFLRWFYYAEMPAWDLMRFAGFSSALGFLLITLFDFKGWKAFLLPMVMIYVPSVLSIFNDCLQDYSCQQMDFNFFQPAFNYLPVAGIGLAIGVIVGWFIPRFKNKVTTTRNEMLVSVGLGIGWLGLVWLHYIYAYSVPFVSWDIIVLWFIGSLLFALLVAYYTPRSAYWAFAIVALIPFAILAWTSTEAIFGTITERGLNYFDRMVIVAPQFELGENGDRGSLLWFLQGNQFQIYAVWIPTLFVLALAAYVRSTYREIWDWIGASEKPHAGRGVLLQGTLLYTMFMAGMISVLSLFSVWVNIFYGVGWSLWGFLTFVSATATWRWKKWGARTLVMLVGLLIAGAIIYDAMVISQTSGEDSVAPLLQTTSLLMWGIWSVVVLICAVGAYRRQIWGGVGLLILVVLWYLVTLSALLPAFTTIQAIAHLALMSYVLAPYLAEMETKVPVGKAQTGLPQEPKVIPMPSPAPALVTLQNDLKPPVLPTLVDVPAKVAQPVVIVEPVMKTEMDIQLPFDGMKTLVDVPSFVTAEPSESVSVKLNDEVIGMRTEVDVTIVPETSKPKLKIDTSAIKPKSDASELKTEFDSSIAEVKKEARPGLKIDTSALKPKTEAQDPKVEFDPTVIDVGNEVRSKFQIDTSVIQPKVLEDNDDPTLLIDDSQDKAKPVSSELKTEFDPSSNQSTPENPSSIKKPRLKFDTSLLKKPKDDETDKE